MTAPFDPDAALPDLHIPVRGLGIETTTDDTEQETKLCTSSTTTKLTM